MKPFSIFFVLLVYIWGIVALIINATDSGSDYGQESQSFFDYPTTRGRVRGNSYHESIWNSLDYNSDAWEHSKNLLDNSDYYNVDSWEPTSRGLWGSRQLSF